MPGAERLGDAERGRRRDRRVDRVAAVLEDLQPDPGGVGVDRGDGAAVPASDRVLRRLAHGLVRPAGRRAGREVRRSRDGAYPTGIPSARAAETAYRAQRNAPLRSNSFSSRSQRRGNSGRPAPRVTGAIDSTSSSSSPCSANCAARSPPPTTQRSLPPAASAIAACTSGTGADGERDPLPDRLEVAVREHPGRDARTSTARRTSRGGRRATRTSSRPSPSRRRP